MCDPRKHTRAYTMHMMVSDLGCSGGHRRELFVCGSALKVHVSKVFLNWMCMYYKNSQEYKAFQT
jgi:hypothetical protein